MHLRRFYAWCLSHRLVSSLVVLAALAPAAWLARGIRVDQSVEQMFPVRDEARRLYDHYRSFFPNDDRLAIVLVEDADLWTPAGLRRVKALEDDFTVMPGVVEVKGPLSARDVTAQDDAIQLAPLFASPELPPAELQAREHVARTDPLFAWNLANPTRPLAAVQVRMDRQAASSDPGRRAFNARADAIIKRHAGDFDRLLLTGIPVIRARYIESVQTDKDLLFPVAYVIITLLIALAFRSLLVTLATVLTMAASIIWTFAAMRLLGIPFAILTSFSPIIILIVSISDTVHIVADTDRLWRGGVPRKEALARAMAGAFGPCLLTEVTIAAGFLSMAFVNIASIWEFGQVMASGVMLTWLANVTVLPLVLSLGRHLAPASAAPGTDAAGASRGSLLVRGWNRVLGAIEIQVTRRPRVVVLIAAAILAASALGGATVKKVHYVFDDLWPESRLYRDLRYAEGSVGGLVPLAVMLEPQGQPGDDDMPVLDPEALRFFDRLERHLKELELHGERPIKSVASVATYLRKAHPLFAGEDVAREDGGLPTSRRLALAEYLLLDDGAEFKDLVSTDGRAGVLVTRLPDMPSADAGHVIEDVRAFVAREAPKGYHAQVTGLFTLSYRVYQLLLEGLLASFGTALLLTFVVFCLVLRSWRLAVVAVIPNLAAVVLMVGLMALLAIDLKPSTVLLFSMVLVIADDDTIQYLARYRRRVIELQAEGATEPHRQTAVELLRELGLPMFLTATAVAAGFLLLRLSEFKATAQLGTVAGLTLFCAVFADLFLAPIILTAWRPRVGRGR